MRKGLTALFLLLVCLSGQVLVQNQTIKGKGTVAGDGSPIIGATIIKGTNLGAVANAESSFSLNVPGSATVLC